MSEVCWTKRVPYKNIKCKLSLNLNRNPNSWTNKRFKLSTVWYGHFKYLFSYILTNITEWYITLFGLFDWYAMWKYYLLICFCIQAIGRKRKRQRARENEIQLYFLQGCTLDTGHVNKDCVSLNFSFKEYYELENLIEITWISNEKLVWQSENGENRLN